MNHGSLFSGIGGFDLAAEWCGWINIFQVEKNPFCQKVLKKNFPETEKYEDIYEFKGEKTVAYRGTIDVLTGGFPCQPFSVAGKQKGQKDDRYLWPEMFRVIQEIKSTWVVAENVVGLISLGINKTISDLESIGYEVQTFIIPACAVGAWHRRDRVWIVAYSKKWMGSDTNSKGLEGRKRVGVVTEKQQTTSWKGSSSHGRCWGWKFEPDVGRVANGIPQRVHRLKALGNAIVPQVAYEIFRCIDRIEKKI